MPTINAITAICFLLTGASATIAPGFQWKQFEGYQAAPLVIAAGKTGFALLPQAHTKVHFTNHLSFEQAAENEIRLNGSGVALGDVNGDGLCDIYLCGQAGPNALYINKGNFVFEDRTKVSGPALPELYCTSAAFADLDGDNDQDLLVGSIGAGLHLFLNDGKGIFTNTTSSSQLNSTLTCSTIALADVDGDNDLDIYLSTYRGKTIRNSNIQVYTVNGRRMVNTPDKEDYEFTSTGMLLEHAEPDQLLINDGKAKFKPLAWTEGAFLDEDEKPLTSAHRDWGLSVQFRDMNQDSLPDIYVCNDFFSPDRIWINKGNLKFQLLKTESIRHTSSFSMGVDFADINRDGFDDFFVTDMLALTHGRRITQNALTGAAPIDRIDRPQVSHNTLFLNRGDTTYSEIGFLAKVAASDWTWSTVFLDVDLDGFEDILVTTGHLYDSQDVDSEIVLSGLKKKATPIERLRTFPKLNVPNYAFRNNGKLTFDEHGSRWGFAETNIAHGMAMADLDLDGDLDVVINNLNAPASIYENTTSNPRVAVSLKGKPGNTSAIGARVTLASPGLSQSQEIISGGRYLSSDQPTRTFAALHTNLTLRISWPDGLTSSVPVMPNHAYLIDEGRMVKGKKATAIPTEKPFFENVSARLPFVHKESNFDDFERQPSLLGRLSTKGPAMLWHDFNQDGWLDLFVGNGRGQSPAFYLNKKGTFRPIFGAHTNSPDGDVTATAATDNLLLVAQSGWESGNASTISIYAYSNETTVLKTTIPIGAAEVSALSLADVDRDNDLDLFVGCFSEPGRYPVPASSVLFYNIVGNFQQAKFPMNVGLVNSAVFADYDRDGDADLVIASDLNLVRTFDNQQGTFVETTRERGLSNSTGLWKGIAVTDFNHDGKIDFAVSNVGLNTPYQLSEGLIKVYFGDWAENGTIGILQAYQKHGKYWPIHGPDFLAKVIPGLGDRYGTYSNFARATADEILRGHKYQTIEISNFSTSLFLNNGSNFLQSDLPIECQFTAGFGIAAGDFNGDKNPDLFLGQNFFGVQEGFSRLDGGRGTLLWGDGKGKFKVAASHEVGIELYGEQRSVAALDFDKDGRLDLAVGLNNGPVSLFKNTGKAP